MPAFIAFALKAVRLTEEASCCCGRRRANDGCRAEGARDHRRGRLNADAGCRVFDFQPALLPKASNMANWRRLGFAGTQLARRFLRAIPLGALGHLGGNER